MRNVGTSEESRQLAIASDFEFVAVMVLVIITFLKPSSCRISLYYNTSQLTRKNGGMGYYIGELLARKNDA
jgi:hypothetical protein